MLTVRNRLNWTYLCSYRVDLSRCVYHLNQLPSSPSSSSSTPSTIHFAFNPSNHQNNSIYCRGGSLLMICSFITIIFNKHPHPFVKPVHHSPIPPKTTPEKWAYHLPLSSTPNSPGKITFFSSPHFCPLSYIPHEKWGYQHPLASTQNFPGNIDFWRVFQGHLSDYKWNKTDDNYTAVSPIKTRLKI